jgi:hypothetical protein
MTVDCSSCGSSTLFSWIITPLNKWPAIFFWGEGGCNIAGKVTWRTLNWVVCVHLPEDEIQISVLYTFWIINWRWLPPHTCCQPYDKPVPYCHALVKSGMQLLWVYLTIIAKYPCCSFCPHRTDCTLSLTTTLSLIKKSKFLISNFHCVVKVVFFLLGDSPES